MTDTNQKLREALQALITATDHTAYGAALSQARQALALPTAAPVGERELFEKELARLFGYSPHAFGKDRNGEYAERHIDEFYMVWQARAALSAGDAVDAQRYRWLMENVVGFECCPPTLLIRLPEDVVFDFSNPSAAIDAAMRKGQL